MSTHDASLPNFGQVLSVVASFRANHVFLSYCHQIVNPLVGRSSRCPANRDEPRHI